jgi:hypothetical protein
MSAWVLPEDGIVDWIAVGIAVSGARRVRLTRLERSLAVQSIVQGGGTAWDVSRRLFLSYSSAKRLVDAITTTPPDPGGLAVSFAPPDLGEAA